MFPCVAETPVPETHIPPHNGSIATAPYTALAPDASGAQERFKERRTLCGCDATAPINMLLLEASNTARESSRQCRTWTTISNPGWPN